MRCYRIWNKDAKRYMRKGEGRFARSMYEKESTAKSLATRLLGKGAYEIHCFRLERSYSKEETA